MQPAKDSTPGLFTRLARALLSRRAVWVYWIVNLALLVGLVIWNWRDARFIETALLTSQWESWKQIYLQSDSASHYLTSRVQLLQAIIVLGCLSAIGIVVALFAGTRKTRSMRAWLAVICLFAVWLTIFSKSEEIAMRGLAWRIQSGLPELDKLATTLLKKWPEKDGQLPELGPYSAYPVRNPFSLIFLKRSTVPGTNIRIASIDRIGDTRLQFHLAGNEAGAWLLYSSDKSSPSSVWLNGILEIETKRKLNIDDNWYLWMFELRAWSHP